MNQAPKDEEKGPVYSQELMAILNNQNYRGRGRIGRGRGRAKKPIERGPPIYAYCSKDDEEEDQQPVEKQPQVVSEQERFQNAVVPEKEGVELIVESKVELIDQDEIDRRPAASSESRDSFESNLMPTSYEKVIISP